VAALGGGHEARIHLLVASRATKSQKEQSFS